MPTSFNATLFPPAPRITYFNWLPFISHPESGKSPQSPMAPSIPTPSALPYTLYEPCKKWSWTAGLSIAYDSDWYIPVCDETGFSSQVTSGKIADRRFCYISKSWSTLPQLNNGFYSELALYKGQLKPLQGLIVPTIIGVFASPGAITVAMEPPHHAFWIEASPNMPHVLKKRCVQAVEKLHQQGVCHKNLQLSQIWIGANAKVTITDFHSSCALIPNKAVELGSASEEDLKAELKDLKVKLEYEKSRREAQIQCLQSSRSPVRRRKTVPSRDWFNTPPHNPKIFVMPKLSRSDLAFEINRFLGLVERLSEDENIYSDQHDSTKPWRPPSGRGPSMNASSSAKHRRSSIPARNLRSHHLPTPLTPSTSTDTQLPKKRKATIDTDDRQKKRKRVVDVVQDDVADATSHPHLEGWSSTRTRPALRTRGADRTDPLSLLGLATPPDIALPAEACPPHFPPVKVRDFAYDPTSTLHRGIAPPDSLPRSITSPSTIEQRDDRTSRKVTRLGLRNRHRAHYGVDSDSSDDPSSRRKPRLSDYRKAPYYKRRKSTDTGTPGTSPLTLSIRTLRRRVALEPHTNNALIMTEPSVAANSNSDQGHSPHGGAPSGSIGMATHRVKPAQPRKGSSGIPITPTFTNSEQDRITQPNPSYGVVAHNGEERSLTNADVAPGIIGRSLRPLAQWVGSWVGLGVA